MRTYIPKKLDRRKKALESLLDSQDEKVRLSAAIALGKIEDKKAKKPKAKASELAEFVIRLPQEDTPGVGLCLRSWRQIWALEGGAPSGYTWAQLGGELTEEEQAAVEQARKEIADRR